MAHRLEERLARRVTALLLFAAALLGVAHLGFMPPWEGFDETAHWSYVQQFADQGRAPRHGRDTLSLEVERYPGPMPYGQTPPFEQTGELTYRAYRQAGAPPLGEGPDRYAPGAAPNWQAQHPPLYYGLMSGLYRAASGLGWTTHLLVLRLASFALAFAGFALAVLATARHARTAGLSPWTPAVMAAWPLLFPQFVPEFARFGNDSLSLFWIGCAWLLTLRLAESPRCYASAGALGAVLGLGLLTKAFFVPVTAGVALWLAARGLRSPAWRTALLQAVIAGGLALAVGGWWYVAKLFETGSLTGSDEVIRMQQAGGWAVILHNLSIGQVVRGLAVLPATFAWTGTWSLARLPEPLLLAPLTLLAVTLFDYARSLRSGRALDFAPIAFAAPMVLALLVHVAMAAAGQAAVTPGYYLHILAPPLAYAVALGWRRPRLLGALAALTGVYTAAAWALQISMFSGCAAKLGAVKHYSLAGAGCFVDLPTLQALGHPLLGFAALAAGAALALAAGAQAFRASRSGAPD